MNASKKRKRLGQHFLTDSQIIEEIVTLINPKADDVMVEIGPGHGALTERLAGRTAALHAIELDPSLADEMRSRVSSNTVVVHHADALKFDYHSLQVNAKKLRIVGNLPYSISSQLLIRLLDIANHIEDMIFMIQREVAMRLTANCGDHDYGRLTVCVSKVMQVETVFDVPPDAFSPPPEVQSTVIYLRPKPEPKFDSNIDDTFAKLVRLAFSNRRKTLRNSLGTLIDENSFDECGVDSSLRAQNLSVDQYMRLAEHTVSQSLDV